MGTELPDKLCDYGCGQKAIHQFKNGRQCCSKSFLSCINIRKKNSEGQKRNSRKGMKRPVFSDEWKRNISKSLKGIKTGPRPDWVKEKIRKTCTGKKIGPMNEDQKKKIGKSNKGKHFGPKSEETKKKLSIVQKKNWANPNSVFNTEDFLNKIANGMSKKPTKPEKEIIKILNELFPNKYEYVGNYKIWIKRKNPDFINKEDKKIIEYFGGWWHEEEVTGKSLEENILEKIKFFKNEGYDTFVIIEKDLKNISKLKQNIIKFQKGVLKTK